MKPLTTFLILAILTTTILTTVTTTTTTAFAQTPPPLESTPKNGSSDNNKDIATAVSLGKATIPVSSGEQIIIDIPLKDGNTYKLVPIK